MVHHVVLCKFHPGTEDQRVEWIMRQTRIRLLKIPEVRAIKCGKRVVPESEWGFFFSMDCESMAKMGEAQTDPIYKNFASEVIEPHVRERLALSYEMEPGKDVRYS